MKGKTVTTPEDSEERDVERILRELDPEDPAAAAEQMLPLVYEELLDIAGSLMRGERANHTLQPSALVHEAFLRLVRADDMEWADQSHFRATAVRAMRRVLINYARDRAAKKRGGPDKVSVQLDEALAIAEDRDIELVTLMNALSELAELSPRQAELVELRFFGGLTFEEAASELGVSVTTAKQDWAVARAWLARELSKGDTRDA